MCLTCSDKSSTNPDLCGAARAARREEAHRVVQLRDSGQKFSEIAEELNTSRPRVQKLFNEGMEVVNRDKRAELEYILQQLDDEIDDARRDLIALANDPIERSKARTHWLSLVREKAKMLDLYPDKRINVKTGPALPEPPDDPELDAIYNGLNFKEKHS